MVHAKPPKAKPRINPAVKWEQLSAAVLEMGANLRILERRIEALEAPARPPVEALTHDQT